MPESSAVLAGARRDTVETEQFFDLVVEPGPGLRHRVLVVLEAGIESPLSNPSTGLIPEPELENPGHDEGLKRLLNVSLERQRSRLDR